MVRSLCITTLIAAGALRGEIPRGQIVDRVATVDDSRQSYALYLPSSYSPERAWPILYCLDPMARGRVPLERFAQAAEKAGFIVAGSNNSRNGPSEPVRDAIRAMVNDTHARFSIDNERVYAAGFSGGARVALNWASNGSIAGVVACGAAFGNAEAPKQIPFKIVATAGIDDFNHDELYRMSRELAKRGTPHLYMEFEGGHDWIPSALADQALDFFAGRIGPRAAEASKEQEKAAARYERAVHDLEAAGDLEKRRILAGFQKDAAKPGDSLERRVARRAVGGTYVGAIEGSRELMNERSYVGAARMCEIAVLARPENPYAWYSLAVAQTAAGNTRRGLEALQKAAAAGYRDRAQIEGEPLLDRLRNDRRYKALLETMK